MNSTSKILVTIGAVIGFIFLFAILVDSRGDSGHKTPGILGLVLAFGLYAGIRSIWGKKESKDDDLDNRSLDKS